MKSVIIFATEEKMGKLDGEGKISWLYSEYLAKYRNNLQSIRDRSAWKTQGIGAQFMGLYQRSQDSGQEFNPGKINGLAFTAREEIVYSISIDNCSGIFSKNPEDDSDLEGHIIHKTDTMFYGVDYNSSAEKMVASISNGMFKHLALFRMGSAIFNLLTEGECMDENPVWSRTDPNIIFYDSCGVGKDKDGYFGGYSPKTICRLNTASGDVEEIISIDKHNCIAPREDQQGSLYFIKKPIKVSPSGPKMTFMDVLFIPIKLLKAVFYWANMFTARYTGDTLTTVGPNPAKAKEKSSAEIFIEGNLINVEKTLKENQEAGEQYPGIAPRSWELMKKQPDGTVTCVKKGVLCFDITRDGQIVYSNGKHMVRLKPDKTEEIAGTAPLVTCLRAL